jgi:hypothetical protein
LIRIPPIIPVIMGTAVVIAAWLVADGLRHFRSGDRHVTVKGVAERDVDADVALWPISFVATSEDLAEAQAQIVRSEGRVLRFLREHGVDSSAVQFQGLEVVDRLANPYQSGPSTSRYIVTQRLMVRSSEPGKILAANREVGELVRAGVVLQSGQGYGSSGPTFLFTKLNDHKPEMIAEATARARESAEQFARDSRSRLGRIRQAAQGVFVVLPRDQAPGIREEQQIQKTLRVVTTVEYVLDR